MQLPEGKRYLQRTLSSVAAAQMSLTRDPSLATGDQSMQILGPESSSEAERAATTVRTLLRLLFQTHAFPSARSPSALELSAGQLARPVRLVAQSLARDRTSNSSSLLRLRPRGQWSPSLSRETETEAEGGTATGTGTAPSGEHWRWSTWFHVGHMCGLLWERERGARVRELVAADACLSGLATRAATATRTRSPGKR